MRVFLILTFAALVLHAAALPTAQNNGDVHAASSPQQDSPAYGVDASAQPDDDDDAAASPDAFAPAEDSFAPSAEDYTPAADDATSGLDPASSAGFDPSELDTASWPAAAAAPDDQPDASSASVGGPGSEPDASSAATTPDSPEASAAGGFGGWGNGGWGGWGNNNRVLIKKRNRKFRHRNILMRDRMMGRKKSGKSTNYGNVYYHKRVTYPNAVAASPYASMPSVYGSVAYYGVTPASLGTGTVGVAQQPDEEITYRNVHYKNRKHANKNKMRSKVRLVRDRLRKNKITEVLA